VWRLLWRLGLLQWVLTMLATFRQTVVVVVLLAVVLVLVLVLVLVAVLTQTPVLTPTPATLTPTPATALVVLTRVAVTRKELSPKNPVKVPVAVLLRECKVATPVLATKCGA
jgi:hypothetical protein